jgi:hypothetical protein
MPELGVNHCCPGREIVESVLPVRSLDKEAANLGTIVFYTESIVEFRLVVLASEDRNGTKVRAMAKNEAPH